MEDISEEMISFELGDIIRIVSPTNDELHNKIFIITYLDENVIEIKNPQIRDTIKINLLNGVIRDESIEVIQILDHPKEKGYARQNGLIPGKYISVTFGGDIPTIINGEITNLEDDMIEITTYKDKKVLYINFDYRGIPKILPILSIKQIKNPEAQVSTSPFERVEEGEEREEESVSKSESGDEEDEEEMEDSKSKPADEEEEDDEIGDELREEDVEKGLEDDLEDGDGFVFFEDLDEIQEEVEVDVKEKRFNIEEQKNDLLDALLSTVPTHERTPTMTNYFHKIIQRFLELRELYSIKNKRGVIEGVKRAEIGSSIIENIKELNHNFKWVIPVIKHKKQVYDFPDLANDNNQEDVYEYKLSTFLGDFLQIIQTYKKNEVPEEQSKYDYLIRNIYQLMDSFEENISKENVVVSQHVKNSLDVLVENLRDFKSHAVSDLKIKSTKFLSERVNKGTTKLLLPDKYSKNYELHPLTEPHKINIKGFLTLPHLFDYTKMFLHKSNILEKSHINIANIQRYKYLNSKLDLINRNVNIDDFDEGEIDVDSFDNLLSKVNYHKFVSELNFDDITEETYQDFLNNIFPKNIELFKLLKLDKHFGQKLKNCYSYESVLNLLESFGIYDEDVTLALYKEIAIFIEFRDLDLKKIIQRDIQIYNNYVSKLSKLQSTKVFNYLVKETNLLEELGYTGENFSNGETLEKMYALDNTQLLNFLIMKANNDLISIDVEDIIEDVTESQKGESKEDGNCKEFVLAKKYVDIDELAEDDDKEIYFDKKYDETRYEIIEEFESQQMSMSESDFLKFLTNHLETNVGMKNKKAKREAEALIVRKKKVIDGDYAILSEDLVNLKYYERVGNRWMINDNLDGEITEQSFCNLKNKCLKINNECKEESESKREVQEKLNHEIRKHFESNFEDYIDEIYGNIDTKIEKYKNRLTQLIILEKKILLKNNTLYKKIASELEDIENLVSPLVTLRDNILAEGDFIKKNKNIIKFVEKFCRKNFPNKSDENIYWFYCLSTELPLLPTFFYDLALVVINDNDQLKNNYMRKIEEIAADRGIISNDGDKIVDKYSGYLIKYIESSNDEGYSQEGFKIVSRDVMQEEKSILNNSTTKDRNFESPLAIQIKKIIKTMNSNINITLKDSYVILIIKNVSNYIKKIKSRNQYDIDAKKLLERGKSVKPYEKYYDNHLMVAIMSYYALILQISIPSITNTKPFKGCLESFAGYPIGDKSDLSLLTYIGCIALKLKNSVYRPWNALPSRKKIDGFVKNMHNLLENNAFDNDEIQQKIKDKQIYLLETFENEKNTEFDLSRWDTFLPILNPFDEVKVTNIATTFENSLISNINSGSYDAYGKIFNLQQKIRSFSFLIQKSIRNIIEKKELLLHSYKDNGVIPYLQNSCCSTNDVSVFSYFVEQDSTINTNNELVKNMERIKHKINVLSRASSLVSLKDTKLKYPEIPNIFSEKTIYNGFLTHCLFNSGIKLEDELIELCGGIESNIDITNTLEENIEILKSEGKNYTETQFIKLLTIVNRENMMKMDFNKQIHNSKEQFDLYFKKVIAKKMETAMKQEESKEESQEEISELDELMGVLRLYNNHSNFMNDENKKNENFKLQQLLDEKINEKVMKLKNFFIVYEIETNDIGEKNILNLLNTFLDWKKVGEDKLLTKDDETGFKIGSFLKTMIKNMMKVYPSIIKNKVDYKNKKSLKHWELTPDHSITLEKNIQKELNGFNDFIGDKEINMVLDIIVDDSEYLLDFMENIPFLMNIQDKNEENNDVSFYNGNIYKSLLYYVFLLCLTFYIEISSNLNYVDYDETKLSLLEESEVVEIRRSQKNTRNKKIGEMLKVYLQIILNYKQSIINLSNEDINIKILKAKEKEKEKMKTRLKNLTKEERDVENYLKNHRLGNWNIGQTSALFKYDKNRYQEEIEEMMGDLRSELEVGMMDETTEDQREIFGFEMQDYYDNYEQKENNEILMGEDDDFGDNDGDEFF